MLTCKMESKISDLNMMQAFDKSGLFHITSLTQEDFTRPRQSNGFASKLLDWALGLNRPRQKLPRKKTANPA